MTVNKIILLGNLGKDPELKQLKNGDAVLNISIATTEVRKDKSTGKKSEEVEWHNVVFYGKSAETVAQYLKKGDSIYIEGRIKTEKYIDKHGAEKYAIKVIVSDFKLLGSRKKDDSPQHAITSAKEYANQSGGLNSFFGDDIPF